MLLKRGIVVSRETIRRWGKKFGPEYVRRLRRKRPSPNDVWHLDEVLIIAARNIGCGGLSIRTDILPALKSNQGHNRPRPRFSKSPADGCARGLLCSCRRRNRRSRRLADGREHLRVVRRRWPDPNQPDRSGCFYRGGSPVRDLGPGAGKRRRHRCLFGCWKQNRRRQSGGGIVRKRNEVPRGTP
ncbi:hypothetical protein SAMN04488498_15110 [Mesorhizobium albiziae]|uniref:Transposase n=1 Tax=Neomesorhizobium albiziae TaxID=335020 RepID=A0A1I4FQG5_9HYPH|nr:hypothetical protein SAMN04488498_15110 [Mesorhizobium albiziae]